jgi:hypothetical protein
VEGLLEDEEGLACCFGINFGFATPPRVFSAFMTIGPFDVIPNLL